MATHWEPEVVVVVAVVVAMLAQQQGKMRPEIAARPQLESTKDNLAATSSVTEVVQVAVAVVGVVAMVAQYPEVTKAATLVPLAAVLALVKIPLGVFPEVLEVNTTGTVLL
jgi:hypothetical protein